ncbi:MAG: hypothetical protein L6V95_02090 [Candidatus Melainabacteria bacterium]|nr:MAG: hypothetical protein L6V95_02090 [Candidatus Melainabacteria bacterium]
MFYLQDLNYKNIKTNNTKIDNSLLQYNILTVGKLKSIVYNLINKGSLNDYTLNENILLYEKNGKKYTFDFEEQKCNVSDSKKKIKYENIQKDKTEFEKTLKNKTLEEKGKQ